ncbi:unnamed protein product [Symbiodinium pilosum]|uniref:Uncharacterized protein n=1 Tax=Symbiodinium pilosum TaxID=2952 RepID=A0A812L3W3_SYMPI|nr:unnamed protein product [Symbiodinium pilosum]
MPPLSWMRPEADLEHFQPIRSAPRALMGKACVMATRRDWKKALECFRKVLHRASPPAPRDGEQLKMLKEVRFALATCFAGSHLSNYPQLCSFRS